jgi:uncharacterized protein
MAKSTGKRRTLPAICHIEIPAPDMAKAKAFYTKVFGWTVEQPPGFEGYALWRSEGVSGGFDSSAKPAKRGGPRLYLAVPDIPRKLKQIGKAGGKITKGKTEIGGGFGFFASFLDPNGNPMCVWSLT